MGPRLKDVVERVYVVAYKEDTSQLESALSEEGFASTVVRPSYTEEELKYSATVRCMLNHRNAWKHCSEQSGLSIVVEADFVPVVGFSSLPVPFDISKKDHALGWLYAGGPVLYELDENYFARGHAASPVAILMGPQAARALSELASAELGAIDPCRYSLWDTHIRVFAQKRGIMSYLPYRHYGEHGGIANSEHRSAGLTATHRADVLYGRLHFLPMYAEGRWLKYARTRMWAKAWGVGRLVFGKYLEVSTIIGARGLAGKCRLLQFAVSRLFSPY